VLLSKERRALLIFRVSPFISFVCFCLLLFVRQNSEDLQNGEIEWLQDVTVVRDQPNEQNIVRLAELCDPESHVRRVHIDIKDYQAITRITTPSSAIC
jgi:hypothetical protein